MTSCVLAFNGQRLDPVSETYHLGNGYRAYSPILMRFTRPDSWSPFGAGGINAYAYCEGDPVNRSDPTGHMSWQAGLGIGLGILGILGAVFTGGASIAAAGSISAAFAGASTVSLVVGTAALVADVTGVASAATEESNPEASAVLGWASFVVGILSMGIGIGVSLNKATAGLRQRLGNIRTTGLSGRGAAGGARRMGSSLYKQPGGLNLNSKNLHERLFTGPLFRVEAPGINPDDILENGFSRSRNFGAVRKMIPEEHDALIVSGSEDGAKMFNQTQYKGSGHLFEINSNLDENIPLKVNGVSLNENYRINNSNLKTHLSTPGMQVTSLADEADLRLYSVRANDYDEIHIYLNQIRKENIVYIMD